MFFTRVGLEQSTDEWVANYKASRFSPPRAGSSSSPNVLDLCCGIGGDLIALAAQSHAIGLDRDSVFARFAHINAQSEVRCDDVTTIDLADCDAWHIDPDRRPGTRHGSRVSQRTTSIDHCAPDRTALEQMLARSPNAAIKLAPATAIPSDWAERCELEWISRDRECKQLVAWHGNLARMPGERGATILFSTNPLPLAARGLAPRTITGQPNLPLKTTAAPLRYIYDVDPAVVAARLTGALAAQHSLAALGPGPTYLTGSDPIDDDALDCFEVLDMLPLRTSDLSRYLRARNIGGLEIKKRGVDITPENLRRDLKLRGNNAATLLLTKITGRPAAILASRLSSTL
jgi:hypothetical protein